MGFIVYCCAYTCLSIRVNCVCLILPLEIDLFWLLVCFVVMIAVMSLVWACLGRVWFVA